MKSIAGVLAVTLNLLILTLIWGFAYLHAYTDALVGSFMPEEYRYLPIPLMVVVIGSDCGAWHHLSAGTGGIFPF